MLHNKKFIAILVLLLFGVAYNNFRYFFMDGEVTVSADDETEPETDVAYEEEVAEEGRDEEYLAQNIMQEDSTGQDSMTGEENPLLVSIPGPSKPVASLEMASVSDLTQEWAPFLLEDSVRNPFLTKEEEDRHRNPPPKKKPVKRTERRKRSVPLITAKMVKMIYVGNDKIYAVINGKTQKEGDQIGGEKLLAIREGAITLLHKGKEREVLIAGQHNQKDHHVELSYE